MIYTELLCIFELSITDRIIQRLTSRCFHSTLVLAVVHSDFDSATRHFNTAHCVLMPVQTAQASLLAVLLFVSDTFHAVVSEQAFDTRGTHHGHSTHFQPEIHGQHID